ncbi:hypothetical protein NDU88_006158 [Pleurodeles waltl]|uniref:Uncharacterized protein n=1 Tax=Pleurodeles waltl TaxID=8319 RepID=A0AAV7NUB4_PLEWA|nr:hypothetical protein NDU88_006158 [Pleurodeles waltl]
MSRPVDTRLDFLPSCAEITLNYTETLCTTWVVGGSDWLRDGRLPRPFSVSLGERGGSGRGLGCHWPARTGGREREGPSKRRWEGAQRHRSRELFQV